MIRLGMVALAALALASCGRQGELTRPGPMFGSGRNIPAQTPTGPTSNADRDGDAASTGTRNTAPVDPSRSLEPASSNPIEGTTDPIGDRPSTTPR